MLGACHALAHVTGARSGLAHGVANGLFLVDVLRANAVKAQAPYAQLARSLGIAGAGDDVAALIAAVDDFVFGVAGLPRRLRDAAPTLTADDLPALARAALDDPDLPTNPATLDETALRSILEQRF